MAVPRSHWHIDREPLPQLPGVEAGGESGTLHRDKSPSLAPPLICAETRQHPLMMPDLLRLIFRFCADDTATLVSCGAVCKTVRRAREKDEERHYLARCALASTVGKDS